MKTFDSIINDTIIKDKNAKAHGNWLRIREGLPLVPTTTPSVARNLPIEHHPKGTETFGFEPEMSRVPFDSEANAKALYGIVPNVSSLQKEEQISSRISNVSGNPKLVQAEGVRRIIVRMNMLKNSAIENGAQSMLSWLKNREIEPQYRKVDESMVFEYVVGCLSDVFFNGTNIEQVNPTTEEKNSLILRCAFEQSMHRVFKNKDYTTQAYGSETLSDTESTLTSLSHVPDFLDFSVKNIYNSAQSFISNSLKSCVVYQPFLNDSCLNSLEFDLKNPSDGASTFVKDSTYNGIDAYTSPSIASQMEDQYAKGRTVNSIEVIRIKTSSIIGTSNNGFAQMNGGLILIGGDSSICQIAILPKTKGISNSKDWYSVLSDGSKVLLPDSVKEKEGKNVPAK